MTEIPLDKEKIKAYLISDHNYTEEKADGWVRSMEDPLYSQELADALNLFLDKRVETDISVENISVKKVMETNKRHYVYAIYNLNRLLKPGISAELKEAMKWPLIHLNIIQ